MVKKQEKGVEVADKSPVSEQSAETKGHLGYITPFRYINCNW